MIDKLSKTIAPARLNTIVDQYQEKNETVPKHLQRIIDEELGETQEPERFLELGFIIDNRDNLEDSDEEKPHVLGELFLKEAKKDVKEKFDNAGLLPMKNGGLNNAIGAVMQCFMLSSDMKDYFLGKEYENIYKRKHKGFPFADILHEIYSGMF